MWNTEWYDYIKLGLAINRNIHFVFSLLIIIKKEMALTIKDFEVGDYIQLAKENRRGHEKISNTQQKKIEGKMCIGVECDKELMNGNDGSFNGIKYFSCAPNKGIFVVPSRICVVVRKACVETSFFFFLCKRSEHVFDKQKTLKRNSSRGRSDSRSPLPSDRTESTKSAKSTKRDGLHRSTGSTSSQRSVSNAGKTAPTKTQINMTSSKIKKGETNVNSKTKTSTKINGDDNTNTTAKGGTNETTTFAISEDANPKQKIDFIISCLHTTNTPIKARLGVIDKYKHLISEDPQVTLEDIKYAITEFKNYMHIQVRPKNLL
ncbi:hypothetical protein RFI_26197, partial [Reticulomyxa filosa]